MTDAHSSRLELEITKEIIGWLLDTHLATQLNQELHQLNQDQHPTTIFT